MRLIRPFPGGGTTRPVAAVCFVPDRPRIGFGAPLHGRGTPGWVKTAANHASTY